MKTVITAIAILSIFTFSACNKCLTCSDGTKYCKGSEAYERVKTGTKVNAFGNPEVDSYGNTVTCN